VSAPPDQALHLTGGACGAVAEPDRVLAADELIDRAFAYYGCARIRATAWMSVGG
jgi:hypothetical protein